jgi:hypothetical protein
MRYLIILSLALLLVACKKKSTAQTAKSTPPSTTSNIFSTTSAGLVGVWILDSTIEYSNNAVVVRIMPSVSNGTDWVYTLTSTSCGSNVLSPWNVCSDKSTTNPGTSGCWYIDTTTYSSSGFVKLGGVPISSPEYIRSLTANILIVSNSSLSASAPKTGYFYYLHK